MVYCTYTDGQKIWARSDASSDTNSYTSTYVQYPLLLDVDQDNDGLLTSVELGETDGVLPSYGASPFYKDIFVQADYMDKHSAITDYENYAMYDDAITVAQSAMSDKLINLHIFKGNKVDFQESLGPKSDNFDWETYFDPIKHDSFCALQPARAPYFHYCLFANRYSKGASTGLSRNVKDGEPTPGQPAGDFMVTISHNTNTPLLLSIQTGTFLHELGHNLGLRHGGKDDISFKPNHISIMNYNFQQSGINKNGKSKYYYSETTCDDIDEQKLSEVNGVQCRVASRNEYYGTRLRYKADRRGPTNAKLDWNNNKLFDIAKTVEADTNDDGDITTLEGGINEYANLNYGKVGQINQCPPTTRSKVPKIRVQMADNNSKYGSQILHSPYWYPEDLFASEEEVLEFLAGRVSK